LCGLPTAKRWPNIWRATKHNIISKPFSIAIVANSAWNLHNFRRGLIRAFHAEGYRVILIAPDGPERSGLEDMGGIFIPLEHLRRRGINPLRELALTRELYRIYRRYEVNTALHFTIKPVIYGSFAARLAGTKNISTLTGLGYAFISGGSTLKLVRGLYRLALRSANKVFFHNPDDRQLFLHDGLVTEAQSVIVGGSGLRLEEYPLAPYSEAIPGRFLFVGRLLVDKGIRELVAAAKRAKAENPALSFHLLGPFDSGNPAGISASELNAWEKEGNIIYDGEASDVRPYLRKASVVVLPSYREGCPRVLLEAAAMGRALIGTDVPGVREVVKTGNGLLVPLKAVDELVRAILQLSQPTADLEAMGRAGRALVAEWFAEDVVVKAYLQAVQIPDHSSAE